MEAERFDIYEANPTQVVEELIELERAYAVRRTFDDHGITVQAERPAEQSRRACLKSYLIDVLTQFRRLKGVSLDDTPVSGLAAVTPRRVDTVPVPPYAENHSCARCGAYTTMKYCSRYCERDRPQWR